MVFCIIPQVGERNGLKVCLVQLWCRILFKSTFSATWRDARLNGLCVPCRQAAGWYWSGPAPRSSTAIVITITITITAPRIYLLLPGHLQVIGIQKAPMQSRETTGRVQRLPWNLTPGKQNPNRESFSAVNSKKKLLPKIGS